jgi:PAS domain S-box-containing protein
MVREESLEVRPRTTPSRRSGGDPVGGEERLRHALRDLNQTRERRIDERTAELRASRARLAESESRFRTIFDTAADGLFLRELGGGSGFYMANRACLRMLGYSLDEFLGLDLADLHRPEDLPFIRREMAKFAKGVEVRRAEVWFRRRDGSFILVELNPTAVVFGKKRYALVAIRDVTQRKEGELALARANRALRAISDCNDVLLHAESEMELFSGVCRIVVETGGYRLAWVGLAEQDRQKTIRPMAHAGFADHFLGKIRATWAEGPRGIGPAGTAIRTGKPALVRDVSSVADYAPWRRYLRRHGCVAGLGLPLLADGRCLGALTILAAEEATFDGSEVAMLTQLANDVAFGISALRARAARRQLERQVLEISEREQRRIGQDVHDGVGQHIAAAKLMCAAVARRLSARRVPFARLAARTERELSEALDETRRVARGLHPVHAGSDALMAALRDLAVSVGGMGRIRCRFVCRQPVLVADHSVATHLYRIAQEATNNAVRHGRPRRVVIALEGRDGTVRLTVRDDGRGLPIRARPVAGLGLSIMRYRASVIGASFTVSSNGRRGTAVVCEWRSAEGRGHGA